MSRALLSCVAFLLLAFTPLTAIGQGKPDIAGDYNGTLGPLHLKLHIKAAPDGSLSCTLDSVDQGALGLPCSDFQYNGGSLSFAVPSVHGTWKGSVSDSSHSLDGIWSQGNPLPLVFSREQNFVPAAKPSAVDGIWLGEIKTPTDGIRVQIQVKSDNTGKEYCTFDSLDQDVSGLDCANLAFADNKFSFDIPAVKGTWTGSLSIDGKTLTGTWTQGKPLPLNFTRQATAIVMPPVPPPTYQPAMAPVHLAQLKSILDADFGEALKNGAMSPSTHVGVTIGIIDHGDRLVFSYGIARDDSIFEIGSMSKTFTGLILSQMVEQGKVKFDEPVRQLLPEGTVAKPTGREITLLDLATQHSGLPRMPDNFAPADPDNPYADYTAERLYAYIKNHGVTKPAKTDFLYSNLGFGLLGQALSDRAGIPYPQLLRDEITAPLGMTDTEVSLSPAQQARFIQGYDGRYHPAHAWDLVAFAGAGAIRSTAADMLTYLESNLHPHTLPASAATTADGQTLPAALIQSHDLRADAMSGMKIALAWLYEPDNGDYWHNGATGGYNSFGFFNPNADYAAIVLVNRTVGRSGSLADDIGRHIAQRLAGKPAVVIH